METTDRLDEVLRRHGHRSTGPRRAVWRVLAGTDGHLTVDRVDELIRERGDEANLASIYRALALFAELGIARETHLGDAASTWELAHPDEHFHLVCSDCGEVGHHIGSLVADLSDHLAGDGHGFEVHHVELTVTGRCASCRAAGHAGTGGQAFTSGA